MVFSRQSLAVGAALVLLNAFVFWRTREPRSSGDERRCAFPIAIQSEHLQRVICLAQPQVSICALPLEWDLPEFEDCRLTIRVGQRVIITQQNEVHIEPIPANERMALGLKFNLNRATARDLTLIPRIGPALARRILDHRQRHGAFMSFSDLDTVSGIGPKLLAELHAWVHLDSRE